MHTLRRCTSLRPPCTPTPLTLAARYTSHTPPRQANVVAHEPAEEAQHSPSDDTVDARIAKYKQRVIKLSNESNTRRQKYEDATLKHAAAKQQLATLRKTLESVEKERDDALAKVEELGTAAESSGSVWEAEDGAQQESYNMPAMEAVREALQRAEDRIESLESAEKEGKEAQERLRDLENVQKEADEAQEKLRSLEGAQKEADEAQKRIKALESAQKEADEARERLQDLEKLQKELQEVQGVRDAALRQLQEIETSQRKATELAAARSDDIPSMLRLLDVPHVHTAIQEPQEASRIPIEVDEHVQNVHALQEDRELAYQYLPEQTSQEYAVLSRNAEAMQAYIDWARDRLEELQELHILQQCVEEADKQRDEANTQRSEATSSLDAARSKVAALEAKIIAHNKNWKGQLNKAREDASDQIEKLQEALQEARADASSQIEKMQETVREARETSEEKARNRARDSAQQYAESEKKLREAKTSWEAQINKARNDTHEKSVELKSVRSAAQNDREARDRAQGMVDKLRQRIEENKTSFREQLNAERADANLNVRQLKGKAEELGKIIERQKNLISKEASERSKFQAECINRDFNVIKRMLPSLPELAWEEQLLPPKNAATRLQNWLFELAGETKDVSPAGQSMLRHDTIIKNETIMAIYTDGAYTPINKMGAAAVVPALGYARMQRGSTRVVDDHPHVPKSGMTELDGLMLALESAAELADPKQRIVIFTDYQDFGGHNAVTTWLGELYREETLIRAIKALHKLEKAQNQLRICWLGKECNIEGNRLAHQAARMSRMMLKPDSPPMVLTDEKWINVLSLRALDEARESAYLSDLG